MDDSVAVDSIVDLSQRPEYAAVEWGILFRPDKEALPRFASSPWVDSLVKLAAQRNVPLKLAAHLCGARVNQVLDGDSSFVQSLSAKGFRRVQVNATKVNGVERSDLAACADNLRACMAQTPQLEWILQKNEETAPLWQALTGDNPSTNMSILFDDSAGTGKRIQAFPGPINNVPCGYAGGIGPANVDSILTGIANSEGPHASTKPPWIDMESSLRVLKEGQDVFDLEAAKVCVGKLQALVRAGIIEVAEDA